MSFTPLDIIDHVDLTISMFFEEESLHDSFIDSELNVIQHINFDIGYIPAIDHQFKSKLGSTLTVSSPAYAPPPSNSINFCLHLNGNHTISKKPIPPLSKTNTNMATYIHRLFMYHMYYKPYRRSSPSDSESSMVLKHQYDHTKSKYNSFKFSVDSGNQHLINTYSRLSLDKDF